MEFVLFLAILWKNAILNVRGPHFSIRSMFSYTHCFYFLESSNDQLILNNNDQRPDPTIPTVQSIVYHRLDFDLEIKHLQVHILQMNNELNMIFFLCTHLKRNKNSLTYVCRNDFSMVPLTGNLLLNCGMTLLTEYLFFIKLPSI